MADQGSPKSNSSLLTLPWLAPTVGTSSAPSPDGGQSRIHLPPSSVANDDYFESPNVLVDRVLRLHTARPAHSRSQSLLSVLSDGGKQTFRSALRRSGLGGDDSDDELQGAQGEGAPLLGGQEDDEEGEEEDRRGSRSRSKSLRRSLPWHKRPSPMWFVPGMSLMAVSMGMIISPKLAIYNELVCRALGDEAGTTVPAPSDSSNGVGLITRPSPWVGGTQKPVHDIPRDLPTHGDHSEEAAHAVVHEFVKRATRWPTSASAGDDWSSQCRKSPAVNRAVAQLNTTLALLMGILSSATTGLWGALSDRRGRRPVLCVALMGTVIMDSIFLLVVNFHERLPGGYLFLAVGPTIDGLLGGISTTSATTNAYLSDCTDPGSRARIFSVFGGIMFAGIAIGPMLGSFIIKATGNTLLPFYIALGMHFTYLLGVMVFLPESLSKERQRDARRRHLEEQRVKSQANKAALTKARENGRTAVYVHQATMLLSAPLTSLRPLLLLLPKKRTIDETEHERPTIELMGPPRAGWDLNLFKIALGWGCYVTVLGIMPFKIIYSGEKFNWGPAENGYFLSMMGFTRVIVLLGILPLLIRIFRPKVPLPKRDKPLGQNSDHAVKEWEKEAKALRVVADSHFDVFLARFSVFADLVAYTTIALNGGSETQFLAGAALQSLGGGAGPAVQSLALAHASSRDSGRLFASLSVLQSICSAILGPLLFNAIFSRTTATWPEAMFWVAVALYAVSLTMLMLVRLTRRVEDVEAGFDLPSTPLGSDVTVNVPVQQVRKKKSVPRPELERGRSVTKRPGTSSNNGSAITLAGQAPSSSARD